MSNNAWPVKCKAATLTYAQAGQSVRLFTLPPNSFILGFYVHVKTAFDGSGTDLLKLGGIVSGSLDDDKYALDVDLSTAEMVLVQQNGLGRQTGRVEPIYGYITDENSDEAAGEVEIVVQYFDRHNH